MNKSRRYLLLQLQLRQLYFELGKLGLIDSCCATLFTRLQIRTFHSIVEALIISQFYPYPCPFTAEGAEWQSDINHEKEPYP